MNPRIEDSVTRVGPDCWLLGSLYVCEVTNTATSNAVTSWMHDGKTYQIRKSSEDDSGLSNDSAADRIHHAGTSAAVWNIGGTFIKVKAWRSGMQRESDTIHFVKSTSSVPVPEVVFSWVDVDWNRSFLILEALKGQTLDHAWKTLSTNQRTQVADTVAQYCKELACGTSERLMTEKGSSLQDQFLTRHPPDAEPSWKPWTLGPYSSHQLEDYLSESLEGQFDLFYFYHADLGPSNIILSGDGSIVGILDWESAAYYPKFWLGTKPLVSAGFFLQGTGERRAWATLLVESLEREGFPTDMQLYRKWAKAIGNDWI